MGKKISVYLTDKEFQVLEKLLDHRKSDSVSKIVKTALLQMFSADGFIIKEPTFLEHEGGVHGKPSAVVFTRGATGEKTKAILKKEGVKTLDELWLKEEKKRIRKKEA